MMGLTKDARLFVDGVAKHLRTEEVSGGVMIPKINALLHKVSASARREKTAYVDSVVSLTAKEKQGISRLLSRLLNHEVVLVCRVAKEPIGGLRLQVGDWIVDSTLSAQVSVLQEQLSA